MDFFFPPDQGKKNKCESAQLFGMTITGELQKRNIFSFTICDHKLNKNEHNPVKTTQNMFSGFYAQSLTETGVHHFIQ